MRVLVTGGAGFIGSHVVDRLIEADHEVIILDNLDPQVHTSRATPPRAKPGADLVVGDVRDGATVARCLDGVDAVIHLAAAVGLAQSMYEIERFVDVNSRGTAVLLQALIGEKARRVRKIVVASSMSLYGEGRCNCTSCGDFTPTLRDPTCLDRKDFEVRCPRCGLAARPVPTPECAPLMPTTAYAVTKRDQEELVHAVGAAYGLGTVALRLFNVYGPGQSLSNPYTGVAAIFSSRLLNGRAPVVFEDGGQTRDFTHVTDVAEAFVRAVVDPRADGRTLNVGAGAPFTLLELGALLAREIGVEWRPEITRSFRKGDIRHCTADTTLLRETLDYAPRVDFREGVKDLVAWLRTQTPSDQCHRALAELSEHGLLR